MPRFIVTIVLAIALIIPASTSAQSGDATWLNNMEGLETGIGRSWLAPITFVEEWTQTEFNEKGTPVSEISGRSEPSSTPIVTDEMQTNMLSALIYRYDSAENAAQGIELFHEAQLDQISRDPRNPATNEFEPDIDADIALGSEGTFSVESIDGTSNEMAVVYLLVQNDDLIYQIFGMFLPGDHIELATGVLEQMMMADTGKDEPVYNMNGESTGGLWEKLNAIEIAMPEGSMVSDIEVYPPADDAVMGDSVVVPQIDLANLQAVPGLVGSWHITYAPGGTGVLTATPNVIPEGVFNIELWIMEFDDPTHATASAISMSNGLIEPLGIISGESGNIDNNTITLVNSGFVRDRSIPEGDAATAVTANGSTLYAARVYSNGPAPTPLAQDLVADMISAEPGNAPESVSGNEASGGMWEVFPQSGDELLNGLEPALVQFAEPSMEPMSTPVGWRKVGIT